MKSSATPQKAYSKRMPKPKPTSAMTPSRRERRKPPQKQRHHPRAARVGPAQQHGEPDTKEEREGAPRLLLDEYPHAPPDQILETRDLQTHLLVKAGEDHAEEGEAAQDVEQGHPLGGRRRVRHDDGPEASAVIAFESCAQRPGYSHRPRVDTTAELGDNPCFQLRLGEAPASPGRRAPCPARKPRGACPPREVGLTTRPFRCTCSL